MSPLLISLGAGALAGLIYALLNVRSPAPPAVALIGLLGMVIGSSLGGNLLNKTATASVPATMQSQAGATGAATAASSSLHQAG